MGLSSRDGLEEERRLFYVWMTHAMHEEHVYVPLRYHHRPNGDQHSWAQPSRFLTGQVRHHGRGHPACHPNCQPVRRMLS